MMESPTMEIPTRIDELTPEWLTAALREGGCLGEATVRSATSEIIGEGVGFLGTIARMQLVYDGETNGAPSSLIAKLPTSVQENRAVGEILGAYWREIHFYRELSGDFPVRVPHLYFGDLSPDPMREKQDGIIEKLDRVPGWLVSALMWGAGRLTKHNAHRYVLLIEDLAPATPGDQLKGAGPETCAKVLDVAARIHGRFWEDEVLDRFWVARRDVGPRIQHRMYRNARKGFRELYGDLLHGEREAAVDWFDHNSLAINQCLHRDAPHTLVHCDFRFDNVFLDEAGGVILADWQLVGAGGGAYDVAYLLSGALPADASGEEEEALLRGYHAALEREGGVDYPFERCLRDYRRGLFAVLQILATTGSVDLTNERGAEMMRTWIDRTLTLLARVPLDKVL